MNHRDNENRNEFRYLLWLFLLLVVMSILGVLLGNPSHAGEGSNEVEFPPMFPFAISFDAPDNTTNFSRWIEKPAGKHGFIRVEGARFVDDAGPRRFWGTNLCFMGCFPEATAAEKRAARLARFGVNCVRLHHMDSYAIWGENSDTLTEIDPERMKRLDYLIHQLKKHGIYVNINLHVSRWFDDRDGFPHKRERPKFDKGLDNFYPPFVALQKKYARDLLTHVNPYTGNPYTREPAVAMVEINNENAMLTEWSRGSLDDLPEPYAGELQKQWNAFLKEKYGTTESLRKAWESGTEPLGEEMFPDGGFDQFRQVAEDPNLYWQKGEGVVADCTIVMQPNRVEASGVLEMTVERTGPVSWLPQLIRRNFGMEKDRPYTVTFRMRSENPQELAVGAGLDHEPWGFGGFRKNIEVGPEWKTYTTTFVSQVTDPKCRLAISGFEPGVVQLDDLSMKPGGIYGLKPEQSLRDETVPIVRHGNQTLTRQATDDFVEFIYATESDYWVGMYRFLKEDLGLRTLVAGTQIRYGPTRIQTKLDYCDSHAYWNHPVFPGRPWDPANWYVRNRALVNSLGDGTLSYLAIRRPAGLPYTVSEYNHPFPNQYAAEGFPMLAAFGRFQKWNGIFPFTYANHEDLDRGRITSYFNLENDPGKMAHLPACSMLFARGDAEVAGRTILAGMDVAEEMELLKQDLSARALDFQGLGLDRRLSLEHATAIDLDGKTTEPIPDIPQDRKVFTSDTGELTFNGEMEGAGFFLADTADTKIFTGFIRDRRFEFRRHLPGPLRLEIGPTRLDWATLSITSLEGNGWQGGSSSPEHLLLTATGLIENSNQKTQSIGENRITLGNQHWGTEPVVCEGIPARLTLPFAASRVEVHALDPSGNRKEAVAVNASGPSGCTFEIASRYQTIWYEVVLR